MTYPSMRDPDGTKPPYGSMEYWLRFFRVYGAQGRTPTAVRHGTEDRARALEALERFKREHPHLN
ncbi:hypothetical protein M2271_003604 [Streptomyces sp. LBL]|nr:hypothetical protein [Streptomyces sp. LBL]